PSTRARGSRSWSQVRCKRALVRGDWDRCSRDRSRSCRGCHRPQWAAVDALVQPQGSNHPQHASVYAFVHDASKLGDVADSCGNSASPEDTWSEWQDLNLRPPRPERGYLASAP